MAKMMHDLARRSWSCTSTHSLSCRYLDVSKACSMVQGSLAFLIRSIHLLSCVGQDNAARQCRYLRTSLHEASRVMHAPTFRRLVQVLREHLFNLFLFLLIRALAIIAISAAPTLSSPFATRTRYALDLGCVVAAVRRFTYGGATTHYMR